MYARKKEFLALTRGTGKQCIVLKGGTGIGKTVTVPQWAFDDILSDNDEAGKLPVAVLVPRKAIAQGLANYISKVRQTEIGLEGIQCTSLFYPLSLVSHQTHQSNAYFVISNPFLN